VWREGRVRLYYSDELVTIYHGDCREMEPWLWHPLDAAVMITDPPYGIEYRGKKHNRVALPDRITGDDSTALRDHILEGWDVPALVFGSWRRPRPAGTRMVLIWDTKGALGMGPTDLPWKPAHQEIYVLGKGFRGHRGSDVLTFAPVQAMGRNGRLHPHEKPVQLMRELVRKSPPGLVVDPFMGSGSTLVAAKSIGRPSFGVEIEERYCEIAANRCRQEVLGLSA
jgi:hypothetical protein